MVRGLFLCLNQEMNAISERPVTDDKEQAVRKVRIVIEDDCLGGLGWLVYGQEKGSSLEMKGGYKRTMLGSIRINQDVYAKAMEYQGKGYEVSYAEIDKEAL